MPSATFPSGSHRNVLGRVLDVIGAVALIGATLGIWRLRAGFQRIYLDFGIELPSAWFWAAFVSVFLGPAIWLLSKDALVPDARIRRRISLAAGFVLFASALALATALLLPIVTRLS